MDLIEAVIATGVSKVVATNQVKRLDETARADLEAKCKTKLPVNFVKEFRTALAKADKRIRGENKGIQKKKRTKKS